MSTIGGHFPKLPRVPGPRPFVAPPPPHNTMRAWHPRNKDRTGWEFPSGIVALRRAGSRLDYWVFLCPVCQREFTANVPNVMQGRQRSCGCYRRNGRQRDGHGRFAP